MRKGLTTWDRVVLKLIDILLHVTSQHCRGLFMRMMRDGLRAEAMRSPNPPFTEPL